MNNAIESVSKNLVYLRELSGLSITKFAKNIHISPKTCKEIENGKTAENITLKVLINIRKNFGIPACVMTADSKEEMVKYYQMYNI